MLSYEDRLVDIYTKVYCSCIDRGGYSSSARTIAKKAMTNFKQDIDKTAYMNHSRIVIPIHFTRIIEDQIESIDIKRIVCIDAVDILGLMDYTDTRNKAYCTDIEHQLIDKGIKTRCDFKEGTSYIYESIDYIIQFFTEAGLKPPMMMGYWVGQPEERQNELERDFDGDNLNQYPNINPVFLNRDPSLQHEGKEMVKTLIAFSPTHLAELMRLGTDLLALRNEPPIQHSERPIKDQVYRLLKKYSLCLAQTVVVQEGTGVEHKPLVPFVIVDLLGVCHNPITLHESLNDQVMEVIKLSPEADFIDWLPEAIAKQRITCNRRKIALEGREHSRLHQKNIDNSRGRGD